jgi:hypothetical protein
MLRLRDFEVRDFGMGFGAAKRHSRFSTGLSTLYGGVQFTTHTLRRAVYGSWFTVHMVYGAQFTMHTLRRMI